MKLDLSILKELHSDVTKASGFKLDEAEMTELAEYSLNLITGKIGYDDVEKVIQEKCGKDYLYREGNKRIVLVSTKHDYVIKIAKLMKICGFVPRPLETMFHARLFHGRQRARQTLNLDDHFRASSQIGWIELAFRAGLRATGSALVMYFPRFIYCGTMNMLVGCHQ